MFPALRGASRPGFASSLFRSLEAFVWLALSGRPAGQKSRFGDLALSCLTQVGLSAPPVSTRTRATNSIPVDDSGEDRDGPCWRRRSSGAARRRLPFPWKGTRCICHTSSHSELERDADFQRKTAPTLRSLGPSRGERSCSGRQF